MLKKTFVIFTGLVLWNHASATIPTPQQSKPISCTGNSFEGENRSFTLKIDFSDGVQGWFNGSKMRECTYSNEIFSQNDFEEQIKPYLKTKIEEKIRLYLEPVVDALMVKCSDMESVSEFAIREGNNRSSMYLTAGSMTSERVAEMTCDWKQN